MLTRRQSQPTDHCVVIRQLLTCMSFNWSSLANPVDRYLKVKLGLVKLSICQPQQIQVLIRARQCGAIQPLQTDQLLRSPKMEWYDITAWCSSPDIYCQLSKHWWLKGKLAYAKPGYFWIHEVPLFDVTIQIATHNEWWTVWNLCNCSLGLWVPYLNMEPLWANWN